MEENQETAQNEVEKPSGEIDLKGKLEVSEEDVAGAPPGTKIVIRVEDKVAYLKKMDRGTMEIALGMIMGMNKDPEYIRAGEIILLKCWNGGDDEIKTNEDYLIPAAMTAYELIQLKEAALKKI